MDSNADFLTLAVNVLSMRDFTQAISYCKNNGQNTSTATTTNTTCS